jgi:fatty acid desaturase
MTGLDIFALIVLITLIVCFLALWALLGMYPGKIARQRNHPQADAINVCGWWGAITMGVLAPIAFVWAYTNPAATLTGKAIPAESNQDEDDAGQAAEEQS